MSVTSRVPGGIFTAMTAFALLGCATMTQTTHPGTVDPTVDTAQRGTAVRDMLARADARFRAQDFTGAEQLLAEAERLPTDTPSLAESVPQRRAAYRVLRGDLPGALDLLNARVAAAHDRGDFLTEYSLTDVVIFLYEGLGDPAGLSSAAARMRAAVERAHMDDPAVALHADLGSRWQIAHAFTYLAEHLAGSARAAARRHAHRARDAFAARARAAQNSLASIAVLDAQLGQVEADASAVRTSAALLDPDQLDPQDLYIVGSALGSIGEGATAAAYFARIRSETAIYVLRAVYLGLIDRAR